MIFSRLLLDRRASLRTSVAFLGCFVFSLCASLPVSGSDGVFTDVVQEYSPSFFPLTHTFDFPRTNGGRGLIVSVTRDSGALPLATITPETFFVAYPYSWYVASEDDIFDAVALESMTPFVANWGILEPIQVTVGVPFFLACWTGRQFGAIEDYPIITPDDTYAWAQFVVTDDGLLTDMNVMSSAEAYGGIVVGENISVPEPSTCMMAPAGIACGGYSLFRRRKRA